MSEKLEAAATAFVLYKTALGVYAYVGSIAPIAEIFSRFKLKALWRLPSNRSPAVLYHACEVCTIPSVLVFGSSEAAPESI